VRRRDPLELRDSLRLGVVIALAEGRLGGRFCLAKRGRQNGDAKEQKEAFHGVIVTDHTAVRNQIPALGPSLIPPIGVVEHPVFA